ncbi:MAG: methyltransferase [Tannerella sp.]|jgi:tRNA1Val (adenine37-N6)-methyltransferase|nr:methyltransferase [Tannerella sp.]
MPNQFFQFKKFTVYHDKCAMKVGTDGVLLGAWAMPDNNKPIKILDIGTGTGLIAMMTAQRFGDAVIDAIDIDESACSQAIENIEKSPFKDRIKVINESFLDYTTEKQYDLIVSNPPYFRNSLKSPDEKRNKVRHNDSLPLKQMMEHAVRALSENGRIALILPVQSSEELDFIIATHGLHVIRRTEVVSVEGLQPKRFLIETATKQGKRAPTDVLVLETKEHKRTAQYQELTKDFYL